MLEKATSSLRFCEGFSYGASAEFSWSALVCPGFWQKSAPVREFEEIGGVTGLSRTVRFCIPTDKSAIVPVCLTTLK